MWSCDLCKSSLKSKPSLLNHKSTVHGIAGRYRCGVCEKYFHFLDEYNKCLRRHTGEKPYNCRIQNCDKSFGETTNRSIHESTHITEKNVGCSQCSNFYKTDAYLNRHIKDVHQGKSKTKCPDCGKVLSSASSLRIHQRQHTGETPFECKECHKQFADKSACRRHELLHLRIEDQPDFPCKICDKAFKRRDLLWNHSQKEHVKQPKNCQICKYTTFLRQNLKDHMQNTHGNKGKVTCQHCDKKIHKRSLKSHVKMVHENPHAIKCSICQKGFSTQSNLQTHHLFHKGLREFPCQLCGKSFFTNSSRKTHFEAIHNEHRIEKSFKCKQCEYTSVKRRTLMEHSQEAHGPVPKYSCTVCTFQATTLSQLKSHKLSHIGLKQSAVKCNICQKMISSKQNLRTHQQIHQESRQVIDCGLCDKSFISSYGRRQHIENIHKGS